MRRMTTLKNHERRITALEGRTDKIDEVLASHSETLYQLKRGDIENRIAWHMLFAHLGLPLVTQEQVDEVLDAE